MSQIASVISIMQATTIIISAVTSSLTIDNIEQTIEKSLINQKCGVVLKAYRKDIPTASCQIQHSQSIVAQRKQRTHRPFTSNTAPADRQWDSHSSIADCLAKPIRNNSFVKNQNLDQKHPYNDCKNHQSLHFPNDTHW